MMTDDAPLSVSIPEHHGKARRTRDRSAILDIGERVVTGVDGDVTVDANVLLAEGDSRIRPLCGILEIFGNGWRVCSNRFCRRARQDGVRVVHRRYPPRITTIACGAPSRGRGCHLILPKDSASPGTCRASREQYH